LHRAFIFSPVGFPSASASGEIPEPRFSQATGWFIFSSQEARLQRHLAQQRDKADRFFASSNTDLAVIASIVRLIPFQLTLYAFTPQIFQLLST
jgi:hypothetical protein